MIDSNRGAQPHTFSLMMVMMIDVDGYPRSPIAHSVLFCILFFFATHSTANAALSPVARGHNLVLQRGHRIIGCWGGSLLKGAAPPNRLQSLSHRPR